MACKGFLFGRR